MQFKAKTIKISKWITLQEKKSQYTEKHDFREDRKYPWHCQIFPKWIIARPGRTLRTCQINLLPTWSDDPPSWAQMSMEQLIPFRLQTPDLTDCGSVSAPFHKSYLRGANWSGRKLGSCAGNKLPLAILQVDTKTTKREERGTNGADQEPGHQVLLKRLAKVSSY